MGKTAQYPIIYDAAVPKNIEQKRFYQEREKNIDSKGKPKKFTWVSANLMGKNLPNPKTFEDIIGLVMIIFAQLSIVCIPK